MGLFGEKWKSMVAKKRAQYKSINHKKNQVLAKHINLEQTYENNQKWISNTFLYTFNPKYSEKQNKKIILNLKKAINIHKWILLGLTSVFFICVWIFFAFNLADDKFVLWKGMITTWAIGSIVAIISLGWNLYHNHYLNIKYQNIDNHTYRWDYCWWKCVLWVIIFNTVLLNINPAYYGINFLSFFQLWGITTLGNVFIIFVSLIQGLLLLGCISYVITFFISLNFNPKLNETLLAKTFGFSDEQAKLS